MPHADAISVPYEDLNSKDVMMHEDKKINWISFVPQI